MTGPERSSDPKPGPSIQADRNAAARAMVQAAAAGALLGSPTIPWLLVVARGQRELAAELEALFRDDARVRVVEEGREDATTLMPRPAPAPTPMPPGRCER